MFKYIILFIAIFILFIYIVRFINIKKTKRLSKIKDISFEITYYMKGFNWNNYEESNFQNTTVSIIDNGVVQGYHFIPKSENYKGIIITLGGSEGGIDVLKSVYLSENGYNVYAISYFGMKNQSKSLINIDIDFFEKVFAFIKSENNNLDKLNIVGSSRGAELALLFTKSYSDYIDKVVLYSQSSHIWEGVVEDKSTSKPAWRFKSNVLPFIDSKYCNIYNKLKIHINSILNKPYKCIILYNGLKDKMIDKYAISINNIKSNILIFVGEKDMVWNSVEMGKIIKEKLPQNTKLHIYKNAGHIFFGPVVYDNLLCGGDYESNIEALIDSNYKMKKFLEKI